MSGPAPGTPELDRHAVQVAAHALLSQIPMLPEKSIPIVREVVKAYLVAHRKQTNENPHVSVETKRLMKMEIGQVVDFPGVHYNTLNSRMKTARRLMGVDARWKTREQPNRDLRVWRLNDGERPAKSAWDNHRAIRLSALSPGESVIMSELNPRQALMVAKRAARIILSNPDADWSGKMTSLGRRITRIK